MATELTQWRARVGDPQARKVPPHVTLLPPTRVAEASISDVRRHLRDVAAVAGPFEMHLHGTGTFRPISQVVFVAVASGISYCELMEADLRSGPLERDIEFPYHPHVTVAHDVPVEMLDHAYDGLVGYDARFTVDAFTAFEQDQDGRWQPRHHFPFGRQP
ncbi:MAG: 2'-5' RNA ligase family protein [Geodermatophilaceae bacterium]|nr:2'-5' RNA ligase family protein [Geodermatophilaceae bacterium]